MKYRLSSYLGLLNVLRINTFAIFPMSCEYMLTRPVQATHVDCTLSVS